MNCFKPTNFDRTLQIGDEDRPQPFGESLPIFDDDVLAINSLDGNAARENQYPFQVQVRAQPSLGPSKCSGSLISASWVVTATSCTRTARQVTMRFGSIVANSGGQTRTATRVINHPNFNPQTLINNIALVFLPTPVSLAIGVRYIRLPTDVQAYATFAATRAIVPGWGTIASNNAVQSHLRYVTVNVIANRECTETFPANAIVATVVCARESNHRGKCTSDIGSPLIRHEQNIPTLIGVASFVASAQLGGCSGGRPQGFVRTASYLGWINLHTRIPIRIAPW